MRKKIIYILGNPLVPADRAAVSLFAYLQKALPQYRFCRFDPTEELDLSERNLIFFDAAVGLEKVTVFDSLNQFAAPPRFSAHDFDLWVEIKFLQKLKKIKRLTIVGIPLKGARGQIRRDLLASLSSRPP